MTRKIFSFSRIICLAVLCAGVAHFCHPAHSQSAHFNNYLTQSDRSLSEVRDLYEKLIASVTDRIVSTIDENGQVRQVRIFRYLQTEIASVDSRAQLITQDVRAIGAYIDNQVYNYLEDHPHADPFDFLNLMLADKSDLSRAEVLGNASDIDLLVDHYAPSKLDAIVARAREILNSFEKTMSGVEALSQTLNRTLNTHADVKDYSKQTSRSVVQGGATIDFLSFNLASGRLIDSSEDDQFIFDYLRGHYLYLDSKDKKSVEDLPKQVIRAYRALIEAPRLQILDPTLLLRQTEEVITLAKKRSLSAAALEQFAKMDRNARLSAGNNLLLYAENGPLSEAFSRLLEAVRKEYPRAETLAEYTPRYPLGREAMPLVHGLVTPIDFVINNLTRGSREIYHGTPSFEGALAMARGGFRLSGGRLKQGTAAYGSGAYFSHNEELSRRSYSREEGYVFKAKIRQDPRIRVIHLTGKSPQEITSFYADLAHQHPNQDAHEVLARVYGIDLVYNQHLIVLNAGALELPRDETFLIEGIYHRVSHSSSGVTAETLPVVLRDFAEYAVLSQHIEAKGLLERFPVIDPSPVLLTAKELIERQPQLISDDVLKNFQSLRFFASYLGQRTVEIDWSEVVRNHEDLDLSLLTLIAEIELFSTPLWGKTAKLITAAIEANKIYDLKRALKIFGSQVIWPTEELGFKLIYLIHKKLKESEKIASTKPVFEEVLVHRSRWAKIFYSEFLELLQKTDKGYGRKRLLASLRSHSKFPAGFVENVIEILDDPEEVIEWGQKLRKAPTEIWNFILARASELSSFKLQIFVATQNEWPKEFWIYFVGQLKDKSDYVMQSLLKEAINKRIQLGDESLTQVIQKISQPQTPFKEELIELLRIQNTLSPRFFELALNTLFRMKQPALRRQFVSCLKRHGWPLMTEHWDHVLAMLRSGDQLNYLLVIELLNEQKLWPIDVYRKAIEIIKAAPAPSALHDNLLYLISDRIKRLKSPAGKLEAALHGAVLLPLQQRLGALRESVSSSRLATAAKAALIEATSASSREIPEGQPDCEQLMLPLFADDK